MIAFPGMLVSAAEKAGIKVPSDIEKFDDFEFPHWRLFCNAQLGSSVPYHGCHWDNAHVIAKLTEEECMTVLWDDLIAKGFAVSFN